MKKEVSVFFIDPSFIVDYKNLMPYRFSDVKVWIRNLNQNKIKRKHKDQLSFLLKKKDSINGHKTRRRF